MAFVPLALLGCFIFLVYRAWRTRLPRGVSFPPGPKGLPFLGLIRTIPHDWAWLIYTDWAKKYGDIVYFRTYGQPLVVLNSFKAVNDLFEKRSAIYSGRPRMVRFVIFFACVADSLFGRLWQMS